VPERVIDEIALGLGADVPMCLVSKPLIARGIGEAIVRVHDLPSFAMVLANPLQAVSTPEVFRKLATKDNTPLDIGSRSSWLAAIGSMRNDLEQPATAILPVIAEVSAMLKDSGATFVRMSGSGATCFGIFDSAAEAEAAARALHSRRPDWYFQATTTRVGEQ
jgi:4-diphosphocytidyl-2-C-methyl-D-erythritol kinase